MVKHIMLLKIVENDDTSDNIEKIKDSLLSLASETNGLVSAEIGYNYSTADYDLVFNSAFKNPAALKHFQTNPKFKEVMELIDSVTEECTSLDYMCESENIIDKAEQVATEKKTTAKKPASSTAKTTKTTTKTAKPKAVAVVEEPVVEESVVEEPIVEEPVVEEPVVTKPAPKKTATKKIYTTYTEDIKVTPIYDSETVTAEAEPAPAPAPKKKTTSKKTADDAVVVKRIEPKGKQIKEGERAMEEAWKCPVCGKINGNFVGLCGCGADKPEIYTPLTPEEVEEARKIDEPVEENNLNVLKNNVLLPSMDEFESIIKPMVTKIDVAIKKQAYDPDEMPSLYYDEKEDEHVSVAAKAAANLDTEDKVELKRFEPKGKQIKDGEFAMEGAWRCPICSKVNGAFVGICGCGVHRPEEYEPVALSEIQIEDKKKGSSVSSITDESTKSSAIKSITDTFNTVKTKSIQTITDAMNNADKDKEISYNDKLLGNDVVDESAPRRIEPKGTQPKQGESAMKNSWICPQCGKENASYIGKCGCGCTKQGTQDLA